MARGGSNPPFRTNLLPDSGMKPALQQRAEAAAERFRTARKPVVIAGLLLLVAVPLPARGADRDELASAEQRPAAVEQAPDAGGRGRPATRIAATLALVGAGVGMVLAGGPEYVPSRFAPGNTPRRVDLSVYLGPGSYPGHSYQLTRRRGDAFGSGYGCPAGATLCVVDAQELADQYGFGFTDGYDLGRFGGLVAGHREGFAAGQAATIRILDANGFVVYDGDFTPASYVEERFSDRRSLRYGGVGLLAAGALISLFWPDSPARNLDLKPLRGGGWIGASFGF